jgi:hypothetical protein
MEKNSVLICVQPCIPYYAWQVEVMLDNFIEVGVHELHTIQCLWAYNFNEEDWRTKTALIQKLAAKYSDEPAIQFYFYEDQRVYPFSYTSSIRPNLLKQHFKTFTYLQKERVFYHDCDIVFTKYPKFLEDFDVSGTEWFVSDTIGYIGYDYIVSKGHDVMDKMCQIVGCHPFFIKARQQQSGGCQYLFSNVDWTFFQKVETDCEELFRQITELNTRKQQLNPAYHELQIWCADMWAILWNAWLRGFKTSIHDDLSFAWATDHIEAWDKKIIFHNAGVVGEGLCFYKGSYTDRIPYAEIEEKIKTLSPSLASIKYADLVLKTSKNTCL